MKKTLPDLSRFELQCLQKLWMRREASIRDIHRDLTDPPRYSTVRKIFERLEEKGAVRRERLEGRAWIYRSAVSPPDMIRREIRRLIDMLFDGAAMPLVAHLAEMEAVSIEDLQVLEDRLKAKPRNLRRKGKIHHSSGRKGGG